MSRRIQQINELIKRELSQILVKEVDFPKDVLVTITRVKTSIDLKRTRVYISVIPINQSPKVFQALNREIYNLQRKINKRLQAKTIPKIEFIQEKETNRAARIEELLEKINNG